MKLEIKDTFWIVEGESRTIFDNEKEAIQQLKIDIKDKKKSILQMFTFKEDGEVEFKQVSWENIAQQLIMGE